MTHPIPAALAFTIQPTDLLVPVVGLFMFVYALWVIIKQKRQRAGLRPTERPHANNDTPGFPGSPGSATNANANRTPSRATPARPQNGRNDPAAGVGRDLEDLAAEIEQLMRRLGADVDQRSARLESLLREADQRIAELNRLQAQDGTVDTLSAGTAMPQPGGASSQMTSGTDDPVARSVYSLADAGHDSVEIARQLKEHVGKVELILALRRG